MSLEEVFNAAVSIVHGLPKQGPVKSSNSDKLAFYSLYKQATNGPCNVPKPGFWNVVEGYKWSAWNNLGDMPKEEAMETYIQKMRERIDRVNEVHNVAEWISQAENADAESLARQRELFEIIGRPLAEMEKTDSEKSDDNGVLVQMPVDGAMTSSIDNQSINIRNATNGQSPTSSVPRKDSVRIGDNESDPIVDAQRRQSILDAVTSDGEYWDAEDSERTVREHRTSSNSGTRRRRHPASASPPIDKQSIDRIQREVAQLTAQVARLTQLLEARQNTLMEFVQQATVSLFGPRRDYGLSWKSIFFFLLWPIIVHLFIKYRRLIMMVPNMIRYYRFS